MIRKIDKYNRIGIPREIQKITGIKSGQAINIQYEDNKIVIYPQTDETIRSYIVKELKKYNEKLDIATQENNEKEIYLYMGAKIELEKCLNKYDELY